MVVGDFSCHSAIWGCGDVVQGGETLEVVMNSNDLICICSSRALTTWVHLLAAGPAVDLSMCDPSICMDFS